MTHDPHDLAVPCALDALTNTERRLFERHLSSCTTCTEQTTGIRETATRLALPAARKPPPDLHRRVMARIARARQCPPPLRHRPVTVFTSPPMVGSQVTRPGMTQAPCRTNDPGGVVTGPGWRRWTAHRDKAPSVTKSSSRHNVGAGSRRQDL